MDISSFQKIKDLTWPEVFNIWREMEENLEHWQSFTKAKGFKSWQEWREKTHANLHGDQLSWALYQVPEPAQAMLLFRGGRFHGWSKWFYSNIGQEAPTFEELIKHPGVHNHYYILDLIKTFPKKTTITALKTKAGDIVVVEGMHRCCALALSAIQGRPVNTDLTVALADWPDDQLPKLGTGWETAGV